MSVVIITILANDSAGEVRTRWSVNVFRCFQKIFSHEASELGMHKIINAISDNSLKSSSLLK